MTEKKDDFDEKMRKAIKRPRTGPPPHDPNDYQHRQSQPDDRGFSEGDSSVSGDRGNRTGDEDSPGESQHHGDDQHHGNR